MKTTKGKKTLILQNPQMPLNVLKVLHKKLTLGVLVIENQYVKNLLELSKYCLKITGELERNTSVILV